MKKIPTVLVRDPEDRAHVLPQVTPGCEWVFAGEGVATRKFDGTCVMQNGDGWWARREVRPGKTTPANFVPVDFDEVTGKTQGWEPITQSGYAKPFEEALWLLAGDADNPDDAERTFELCGPKIQGNPEHLDYHQLFEHSKAERLSVVHPVTPADAIALVRALPDGYEGVVWHHPDGRMAKLKVRDIREGNTE